MEPQFKKIVMSIPQDDNELRLQNIVIDKVVEHV